MSSFLPIAARHLLADPPRREPCLHPMPEPLGITDWVLTPHASREMERRDIGPEVVIEYRII